VVADDTPAALKRQIGGDRVTVTIAADQPLESVAEQLAAAVGLPAVPDTEAHTLTFEVGAGVTGLATVVRALDDLEITPEDLVLRRPTLDEVFLTLTAAPQEAAR
jgi:ABC-2 type transport system ATP-binding protein